MTCYNAPYYTGDEMMVTTCGLSGLDTIIWWRQLTKLCAQCDTDPLPSGNEPCMSLQSAGESLQSLWPLHKSGAVFCRTDRLNPFSVISIRA